MFYVGFNHSVKKFVSGSEKKHLYAYMAVNKADKILIILSSF